MRPRRSINCTLGEVGRMELFAAATACTDATVASFFLERGGDNIDVAVNHYFDAPNAALGASFFASPKFSTLPHSRISAWM